MQPALPAPCRDSFQNTTPAWLWGVLSLRHRDGCTGGTGPEADVSDWEHFMSCRANDSDWLSGQGCLSESLKGPF